MTSETELRQVAAQLLRNTLRDGQFGVDYRKLTPYKQYDMDDKDRISELHHTWPIPDLPPSDYEHATAWEFDDIYIEPGEDGAVLVNWDVDNYDEDCRETHTLNLTTAQVQAIIAAHYHREDQE